MNYKCVKCKYAGPNTETGFLKCFNRQLCTNNNLFKEVYTSKKYKPSEKPKSNELLVKEQCELMDKIKKTINETNSLKENMKNKKDMVNHPSHYNMGEYEAIDVIEDWKLNFNLGNTVKYISRAGHKDDMVQDLKKSLWYLEREIKRIEKESK